MKAGPQVGSAAAEPDSNADIISKYGRQVRMVAQRIQKNPELLDNPADLLNLTTSLVPDPKFHRAFANFILSRYGRRSQGASAPGPDEGYLRAIQRQSPGQTWVYEETGKRAFARGDYKTAYNDYSQALERGDRRPEIYVGYGVSAYSLGDYTLAVKIAKIVLNADAANRDALALYHAARDRTPSVQLPSVLGGASASQQAASGAGGFGPAVGKRSGPRAAERSAQITREAEAALRMKDYPVAHELSSEAIKLNASNAQALNFRAIASNRMLRFADAVTDADAALALAPGNAPALQTRSWALAKLGRYQEALRDAVDTLARDPASPYAYQNKALALAGLNDRAGVLNALRRSAALDVSFLNRYERALQLPQETDLTLLFDDDSADRAITRGAASTRRGDAAKRFARLSVFAAVGGVLIALAVLHVVSAGWREKVRATFRRLRAPSDEVNSAFWTQYELVKEIGLGGMGVVYEAKDRSLDRRVAVKKMREEIRIDPHERRRFVNEAKLVASLRHPNIVDVYAISEDGDDVYLVFEFVEGRTLHDQIQSEAPMTLEAARGVLGAVASAVEHAHTHQIVHRDLKPSNIMVAGDGCVKVMDFGVARQAKDTMTKISLTNTIAGTPPYMAPEQERGAVSRESDVYALGVCLYEMLTGQLPFSGGGAAMLLNKLNGKHIPPTSRNPSLPAALDEVIAKVLTPDPEKRYHTPTELVAAFDAVVAVKGR